ncbi:MAG: septum formation inhibitor Maf [Desulfarculus sp.]|nr:MAG: septum formation inhibitor Maf [Desulfarculus sp.]
MYRLRPGISLILASASPRRQELLARVGLRFAVTAAQVDENLLPSEGAKAAAQRLAGLKARAVERRPGQAVLAADTLVVLGPDILGKPADAFQAAEMLRLLSGREHQVVTGFCLRDDQGQASGLGLSIVRFRELRPAEIAAYVASGEPLDKAGAYAVQGLGAALVSEVGGSYTNVVGLPLAAVLELMLSRGIIEPRKETP